MQLRAPQADGASLLTHLQRAAPYEGADPRLARLAEPLPPTLVPLWEAFCALSHSRQGEGGIAPTEIEAYGRLHQLRLTSWEVDTILATDRAWRAAEALHNTPKEPRA